MSVNNPSASSSKGSVGLLGFIGVVAFIIWIGALLWQTTTSEAQAYHSGVGNIMGIQGALNQWTAFVQGRLSPEQDAAFIYAWGVEAFVLIGTTSYAIIAVTIGRGHPLFVRLFGIVLAICFLLDFGSDFNYLPDSLGFWTRAIVSLLIAASVAFLGAVAFGCAEHVFKHH